MKSCTMLKSSFYFNLMVCNFKVFFSVWETTWKTVWYVQSHSVFPCFLLCLKRKQKLWGSQLVFIQLFLSKNCYTVIACQCSIHYHAGLSLKYSKVRRTKSRYQFSRIRDIAVRGHGRLDNLTLARSAHMDHFFAAADWLAQHQDSHGGWPIVVSL